MFKLIIPISAKHVDASVSFYSCLGFNLHENEKNTLQHKDNDGMLIELMCDKELSQNFPLGISNFILQCNSEELDEIISKLHQIDYHIDALHELPYGKFLYLTDPSNTKILIRMIYDFVQFS